MSLVQVQNIHETHVSMNLPTQGSVGADEGSRVIERPKLILKPRTQPIELSDGNADKERSKISFFVNLLISFFTLSTRMTY